MSWALRTETLALLVLMMTLGCSDKATQQPATTVQPPEDPARVTGIALPGAGKLGSAGAGVEAFRSGRDAGVSGVGSAGMSGAASDGSAGRAGSEAVADGGVALDSGLPPVREGGSDTGSSDAGSPDAAVPAIACPADPLRPGETRASLMHEGRIREFLIYVPSGYDNTRPVPLVLNFHGATMTATQQRDFSAMNPTADAKGFIVVYPQGVGNSWNAGACCGEAQSSNVDDVGFARAMLESVREKVCIDSHRIYSAGFSNGGRMSYRLGCEMADVFAAIAPVAGTKSFPDDRNTEGCKPAQPISLIDFMGSADPRSAAQPGQIAEWVAFNSCSDATPVETYRMGQHFCSTYSQCAAATSVTFCIVDGGDHCWPGAYPCLLGNTSRPEELSANDLLWQLFEKSTR